MLGLYLHVPFCAKICDYCDFSAFAAPERFYQEYAELLLLELNHLQKRFPEKFEKIETLYLGGGTPSILPTVVWHQIFSGLKTLGISGNNLREVTMEANPESCLPERIEVALEYGVRRFSLGVQTFDETLLKRVGRTHAVDSALSALAYLESLRAHSVRASADLMFSLPGQSVENFIQDVERLSKFKIGHISFYGLNVSPQTVLGDRVRRGVLKIDEDLYADMYNGGVEVLTRVGFSRYEVSNFCLPGEESLHNQNYWNRGEYIGVGPGAHSFLNKVRFSAPEKYSKWKSWIQSGFPQEAYQCDVLSSQDEITEMIWLSLRQAKGLNLNELQSKYHYHLTSDCFEKWIQKGWLECLKSSNGNTFLRLVGDGWVMMDSIVEDLMPN